jgi:hypothetical protein
MLNKTQDKHRNILFAALILMPVAGVCDDLPSSGFDGLVSVAYSKPRFENVFKGLEKDGIDYRASIAWQTSVGLGAQVDFSEMQQKLGDDPQLTLIPRSTAIHGFFRNSTLLAGVLYQEKRQKIDVEGVTISNNFFPRNITAIEAQWYGSQVTWYGQFGRQRFMFDAAPFHAQGDVGFIQFRFFPKENWLLSAGFLHSMLNSPIDRETLRGNAFIAGIEYQVSGTPLSLFAQHMEARYQVAGLAAAGAGLSKLGVKFSWGRSSLQQRDRTGASLDPIGTDGLIAAPRTGI